MIKMNIIDCVGTWEYSDMCEPIKTIAMNLMEIVNSNVILSNDKTTELLLYAFLHHLHHIHWRKGGTKKQDCLRIFP